MVVASFVRVSFGLFASFIILWLLNCMFSKDNYWKKILFIFKIMEPDPKNSSSYHLCVPRGGKQARVIWWLAQSKQMQAKRSAMKKNKLYFFEVVKRKAIPLILNNDEFFFFEVKRKAINLN